MTWSLLLGFCLTDIFFLKKFDMIQENISTFLNELPIESNTFLFTNFFNQL
jgi:hypothetical protein